MKTLRRNVKEVHDDLRQHLLHVHGLGDSIIVEDPNGTLAVLLPCLPDGAVDYDVVAEHNRAVAELRTAE